MIVFNYYVFERTTAALGKEDDEQSFLSDMRNANRNR